MSLLVAVLAMVTTSSAAEPGDMPRRPEPPPAPRAAPPPKPPPAPRAAPPPRRADPPPGPRAETKSAAAEPELTDHAKVIDRIGVGWFGVSNIVTGVDGTTIVAPTLGARIWLDEGMGVDVGVGLAFFTTGGEESTGMATMSIDGVNTFGILAHAGLPIALYASDHYTFLAIPEANFGFGRIKDEITTGGFPTDPVERTQTGVRLEVGARLGAEIQFGFIGVPELALEASVGARFSHERVRRAVGETSVRFTNSGIQTLSVNDPWDFFRSTVAARYYF